MVKKKTSALFPLLFALVMLGAALPADAEARRTRHPVWYMGLGFGLAIFPMSTDSDAATELDRQLDEMAFDVRAAGPGLSLSFDALLLGWRVDRDFAFWLGLGAELSYAAHRGAIDEHFTGDVYVGGEPPDVELAFRRLTGLFYIQAALGREEAAPMLALRFGVGGGAMYWKLRDDVDTGSVVELRPSLLLGYSWDRVALHGELGIPLCFVKDLGPRRLSHSPTFGVRLGARLSWIIG